MRCIKPNYLVIPLIALVVLFIGHFFTSNGLLWYQTIRLPALTPSGFAISLIWQLIFLLTTISLLYLWNTAKRTVMFWVAIIFFGINAFFNVVWSYLFFYKKLLGVAIWDALLIEFSLIILLLLLWPRSRVAAFLLVPYALWAAYAIYLNFMIWMLN